MRTRASLVAQTDINLAEAVVWRCSVKNVFLEGSRNSQENTCAGVFLSKTSSLKATLRDISAKRFFSEFCEIFENSYFAEHL